MTFLSVPDMKSESCVKRISNTLTDASLKFSVDLYSKTVAIDGDERAVERAVNRISSAGYPAERV